ncbi:Imo32p [Lachancea thermotolerans CBS 6340]|uniref:KLTH0G17776p n=1 Tax=Lachancea thermotolerans (strain ATCC 56472 / CBS 6340 / NRRL Y-8284) TaxID=559295 RepID=C5DNK4_LACTC|nr:KLTH0G17776p [Lachancea thermotolerans CBS 6340]CAR25365.1 KLTH0G17776p [Lachancea thermotolerans CBS 6340]
MKSVQGCGVRLFQLSRILAPANHGFLTSLRQVRGYSEGPLFGNHNNTFRTTTRQGAYGSTEVLNDDLLSDSIPRVKLAYEVVTEHSSTYLPRAPIIILHGLFGTRANNRTIARMLNERLERDVYLPDLRNHGQSPHIGRHDYPAMAADVEQFIHDQNFEQDPILVGHSMGAKVVMSVALRKPELCSMIVSIDNAPVATMPTMSFPRYVKKLLEIIGSPKVQTFNDAEKSLREVEDSLVIRQFLLTTLQRVKDEESGGYRFKSRIPLGILNDAIIKGNIANWEFNPWVHRCTAPALFIRGTKSHYVADEYLSDVGRFFPKFEVRDIDATHWVNTEKPRECSDLIADFIERHEDV